ncbi:UbiA prenyltransferase family protein [Haliangium ochraceum]|uniref:UbiA prenyltransferase n=1 Tax=Haliangium ochraceum (strain DSM 14365 / JCM 11303 / SMP-2) TaxID=502025 RepID=D0LJH7_HALO1|nr:UbiA prenyltransferase family protein [Haliangium ochraceum]ACY16551.1 UbiA prenyltransferase [Haliangium ochraceum DSM 14365]
MTTARAIWVTLRPHQWVKNLFVIAPLVFSKHLFEATFAARALVAALCFCALSGAVYSFNDLRDIEMDRAHPIKRNRPIAAGALGQNTAIALCMLLTAGALTASAVLSWQLALAAAGYLIMNVGYSMGLKRLAYVDVLIIAAGFLLRVIGGAFAIEVPISPWLIACTVLLSSLLGFGKRAHEVIMAERMGRDPSSTRSSLRGYRARTLTWIMLVLAAATTASYALYTQDARTVSFFHTHRLVWTLPFCVLGIARFLQLALWRPRAQSPTEAMLRDGLFLLNIALWGVAVMVIIYGLS